MKASVIIPSYNRTDLLKYTLPVLTAQLHVDLQIVIADESKEGDKELFYFCDHLPCDSCIIHTGIDKDYEHWRSPSIAINRCVKRSKHNLIILSCPEIFLFGNILEQILSPITVHDTLLSTLRIYDDNCEFLNKLKSGETFITHMSDMLRFPLLVNYELPFFMAMHKKYFNEIGGYDEDFSSGVGFDDVDFIIRMKSIGCRVHLVTNIYAIHLFHGRTRDRGVIGGYDRNQKLFKEKHNAFI